ncbi:hypothetical protein BaRGS_00003044 [Batillaria attramentaria]|uniref:Uncharacterized protein n=1 Tax=Batillaria attramentaria TaxID=370345 RepID=A0ABD0M3E6_9CAEN
MRMEGKDRSVDVKNVKSKGLPFTATVKHRTARKTTHRRIISVDRQGVLYMDAELSQSLANRDRCDGFLLHRLLVFVSQKKRQRTSSERYEMCTVTLIMLGVLTKWVIEKLQARVMVISETDRTY